MMATGGKHQVDEERPSPRGVGGEDATQEESQCTACAGDSAVNSEGLPTFTRISERGGQEGQYRRREQGTERALDGPGDDEHREVDRGTTDGRGHGEADQSDDERTLAPNHVPDTAAEEEQASEGK